ncbi:MAG: DUF4093 domain-containing protein [Clostridia bacterium]|nr:DUF4093 domain-containing protein [Clostridia bacterium]
MKYPVIVEGKYDKIKLDSIIDATVIATDGFGVYKSEEKQALLRALASKEKVIVLTDPDGAGLQIRAFLTSVLPKERLIHLYVPEKKGKEKRKEAPSAQGLLGVEGIDAQVIRELFTPFCSDADGVALRPVTKADLFADGLSGGEGAAGRRRALCERMGLPTNISANALLDIINLLYGYDRYKELI